MLDDCAVKSYQVLDHHLIVLSEVSALAEHIHCFAKLLAKPKARPSRNNVRLALFPTVQKQVLFCCPELGVARCERMLRPAWVLFRRIFLWLLTDSARKRPVLHACAVSDGIGRTALLLGSSGSGKTSLMLALLQRGFKYVADDYVVANKTCNSIVALPIGATVTKHSFGLLPQLDVLRSDKLKFFCQREWQWTINPADLYPHVAAFEILKPSHFFFLSAPGDEPARISRCEPEVSLPLLIRHQIRSPRGFPQRFSEDSSISEFKEEKNLLQGATTLMVTHGNIDRTADLIAEAIGSR